MQAGTRAIGELRPGASCSETVPARKDKTDACRYRARVERRLGAFSNRVVPRWLVPVLQTGRVFFDCWKQDPKGEI